MNTTMAPIDQILHESLEVVRRHQGSLEDLTVRRRDGGDGNNGGENRGKDNGNGTKNKKGGDDKQNNNPPESPAAASSTTTPEVSITPTVASASQDTTTLVASTTIFAPPQATTIVVTSTMAAQSLTSTAILTETAIATSAAAASSSVQDNGRKGVTDSSTTSSAAPDFTNAPVPESILAAPSSSITAFTTSSSQNGHHNNSDNNNNNSNKGKQPNSKPPGLSPAAEGGLIAVGVIGGFIILIAVVWLILRMKKIDVRFEIRNRKVRKGGNHGLYGWRKTEMYSTEPPPQYDDFASPEKSVPFQQQMYGVYAPSAIPTLAKPETAATLSRMDSKRQLQMRDALLDNAAPFEYSPASQPVVRSATETFYNVGPRAQNDGLTRQDSAANYTIRSQNTQVSAQTSNLNDPDQRELGRMSFLSSLSSGFGDGLLVPDPTNPNSRQTYRQSQNPGATRFSWARTQGQRDTIYTTTSEETAPRFRTVNSWVAQQTGRVERQAQANNIPDVPAIPMQAAAQVEPQHRRNISDDPVFQFHPGDEVQISRGSRVPSEILNKKTGISH